MKLTAKPVKEKDIFSKTNSMKTINIGKSAIQYDCLSELKFEFNEYGIKIGKNVVIGDNCHIGKDVVIGDNCDVGESSVLNHKTTLRRNVKIGISCDIGRASVIGESTVIGDCFTSGTNVNVGSYCTIGDFCAMQSCSYLKNNNSVFNRHIVLNNSDTVIDSKKV